MSSVEFVGPLQATLPVATDALAAVLVALSGGLVGMSIRNMFESIMSEDEDADAGDGAEAATADGGGLMAETDPDEGDDDGEGEDLGGLGGLEDDGEDLGGFDDDAGFGDMDEGGGGGDVDELEHRLEEMEAEVGSLSSTVNTVRNENEQISESVAEVEENVRKLLDIYEMVTRGVNPFADDIDAGMAGGGMDGGFGLFDDGGGGGEDPIDQDIAEADAEGFFDEDLVEDDEELEADADVGDVLGDGDEEFAEDDFEDFDDEFEEDFEDLDDAGEGFDDGEDGGDADGGGGTSFQDLKEEYESGDAEWAAEEFEDAEAAADALEEAADDGDEADDVDEESDAAEAVGGAEAAAAAADDLAEDDLFDDVVEDDESPVDGTPDDAAASAGSRTSPSGTDARAETKKPYLDAVPSGYAAELLVVEWLEYLVDEAGVREAARAIDYYESIDWIQPAVADDLGEYLAGFDGGGDAALTIDHHARSLRYIGQLNGGGADAIAMQRRSPGGGSDGIQR